MDLAQLMQMLGQMGASPKAGVSAPNALQNMQARKEYNKYAIEAQSMGEQPLPFEEWVMKPKGMMNY